ncbi:hypothetical protein [Deinococcus sedimenti]|uniref:Uncharacterized protein n=1 Tax=Deinococcus sedimenti TaxID=1867090 RepID=A0ABQ2S4Q6_9DEIO|nr:hypothetical protein [Deinococcus sedimenti]GGR88687.1 hypothetical protein GCM10008960_14650 [Deinococcus sedimenti]
MAHPTAIRPLTRLALTVTLGLSGMSGAQNAQPHPQPGTTWTAIIAGQVMQYVARETDKDGDSVGTLTGGGRAMTAFVIHSADRLRLLGVDGKVRWTCDIPAAQLRSGVRELTGESLVNLSTPKETNGAGPCRLYTADALPATRPLNWTAVPSTLEWELDTPDGPLAVRLTGNDQPGSWGRSGLANLTTANAAGRVLTVRDDKSFTLALLEGKTTNVWRYCTVSREDQTGTAFLVGRYMNGQDTAVEGSLGECILRSARSGAPQAVSTVPRWPLPLNVGQLWEVQLPQGTFRGLLGDTAGEPGSFVGGWFGPSSGVMNVWRSKAGTKDEQVYFLLKNDAGDLTACVVEQGRDMGIAKLDQFQSPGIYLTNRVIGSVISRAAGKDAEDGGECWVRPLTSSLIGQGLK